MSDHSLSTGTSLASRPALTKSGDGVTTAVDVLVIGGGPAGCWAAISAAESGASVALVDKGYCGTTGATASGGVGVWYIDPTPEAREAAIQSREEMSGWLVDRNWMHRVLDETYAQVGRLADWGYPFPSDEHGTQVRRHLQGPEYMRRMRRQVVRSRVRILDHSPALELLRGPDGEVAGARGIRLRHEDSWRVEAGAVVIATGGCGFLSGGLGCNVLTGDGHLMAAELGADLSGMEFSNSYAISPAFGSVTKTAFYKFATFYTDDGVLEGASAHHRSLIARELSKRPVYAQLDRTPPAIEADMRKSQPNFFLPFDREGINPFTQRFPVTMRLEGTIRGTGGLQVTDEQCATTVRGLYAAGDAATRELICGGFTGGGSHNAAWAISSGSWAGRGAAGYARANGRYGAAATGAGAAGLRPTGTHEVSLNATAITAAVQAETHPYDKNYFRTGDGLEGSLSTLDDLWQRTRAGFQVTPEDAPNAETVRARESVSMLAHARWMYRAAHARDETRGMHKRIDHPELDPVQQNRRLIGGLDEVWTEFDPQRPYSALELTAA